MSRRQVAPGVWTLEDPATPHRYSRTYAVVMANTIPDMRPTLSYGGLMPKSQARKPETER